MSSASADGASGGEASVAGGATEPASVKRRSGSVAFSEGAQSADGELQKGSTVAVFENEEAGLRGRLMREGSKRMLVEKRIAYPEEEAADEGETNVEAALAMYNGAVTEAQNKAEEVRVAALDCTNTIRETAQSYVEAVPQDIRDTVSEISNGNWTAVGELMQVVAKHMAVYIQERCECLSDKEGQPTMDLLCCRGQYHDEDLLRTENAALQENLHPSAPPPKHSFYSNGPNVFERNLHTESALRQESAYVGRDLDKTGGASATDAALLPQNVYIGVDPSGCVEQIVDTPCGSYVRRIHPSLLKDSTQQGLVPSTIGKYTQLARQNTAPLR